MTNEILKTNRTRKSERIRLDVSRRYVELRATHPDSSDNLIFTLIAEERDLTVAGVRKMCLSTGATAPVRQQKA